jgi:hypothetical protein
MSLCGESNVPLEARPENSSSRRLEICKNANKNADSKTSDPVSRPFPASFASRSQPINIYFQTPLPTANSPGINNLQPYTSFQTSLRKTLRAQDRPALPLNSNREEIISNGPASEMSPNASGQSPTEA